MSQFQVAEFFREYGVLCGKVQLENGNFGILYLQPRQSFAPRILTTTRKRAQSTNDEANSQESIVWAIARFPEFDILDQESEDFDFDFAVSRQASLTEAIDAKEIFGRQVTWITDVSAVAAIKEIYLDPGLTDFLCVKDELPKFQVSMISDLFNLVEKIPITRYGDLISLLGLLEYIPGTAEDPGLVLPFQNHKSLVAERNSATIAVNSLFEQSRELSGTSTLELTVDLPFSQLAHGGFMLSISRYQPGSRSATYIND